jgi:hypothetical protein
MGFNSVFKGLIHDCFQLAIAATAATTTIIIIIKVGGDIIVI